MKKRRRRNDTMAPMAPSPRQMLKWSADSMARSAIENHPKVKRAKNAIADAVMAATEKALAKTLTGKA